MTSLPPPVPIHKTPLPALNTSMIQSMNPPVKRRISYLGRNLVLSESEISSSSSDESEGEDNRYSTETYNSTEEHQFWQVHSSTTIISPPTSSIDYSASIEMSYVPKKKKITLALQVRDILGSTFDTVDNEIEKEWESSRIQLKQSLIVLPTLSLSS